MCMQVNVHAGMVIEVGQRNVILLRLKRLSPCASVFLAHQFLFLLRSIHAFEQFACSLCNWRLLDQIDSDPGYRDLAQSLMTENVERHLTGISRHLWPERCANACVSVPMTFASRVPAPIVRPVAVVAVAFITNLRRNALGRIVDAPDFHRAALHVKPNLVHAERATVNAYGRN